MLRPRIIPCLLIHKGGVVKTQRFSDPKYIGDPINAVRIFNEKEADELIVLDIDATVHGMEPNFALISKLAAECRMPLCYGGGVKTVEQTVRLVDMGVEKVATSSVTVADPSLISDMAAAVGKQSIVVVLDIRRKKNLFNSGFELRTHNSKNAVKADPLELASTLQTEGAGEIVLNSVDRDGMMKGYDLELAALFRQQLDIPVTMLGGAGSLEDMAKLIEHAGISGAAAGSIFVFKGKYKAVLINYPTLMDRFGICGV